MPILSQALSTLDSFLFWFPSLATAIQPRKAGPCVQPRAAACSGRRCDPRWPSFNVFTVYSLHFFSSLLLYFRPLTLPFHFFFHSISIFVALSFFRTGSLVAFWGMVFQVYAVPPAVLSLHLRTSSVCPPAHILTSNWPIVFLKISL